MLIYVLCLHKNTCKYIKYISHLRILVFKGEMVLYCAKNFLINIKSTIWNVTKFNELLFTIQLHTQISNKILKWSGWEVGQMFTLFYKAYLKACYFKNVGLVDLSSYGGKIKFEFLV